MTVNPFTHPTSFAGYDPNAEPVKPIPGSVALFDPAQPAPLPTLAAPAAKTKPKWSKFKNTRGIPCDVCKLLQHAGKLNAYSRRAAWKRIADGQDTLLCREHAVDQRTTDGLDIPKGMK